MFEGLATPSRTSPLLRPLGRIKSRLVYNAKRSSVGILASQIYQPTLNFPTSVCRCVPSLASSMLEAAVCSLAAAVCSEMSRTLITLRLICSATTLCSSLAAAIVVV